jgi:hypothetical protein
MRQVDERRMRKPLCRQHMKLLDLSPTFLSYIRRSPLRLETALSQVVARS